MTRLSSQPPNDANDETILLGEQPLTIDEVARVARHNTRVKVAETAELNQRLQASIDRIRQAVEQHGTVYGVNTGFGGMAPMRVTREDDMLALQRNLIWFLKSGCGQPIPQTDVRAGMLLRIVSLLHGASGARRDLCDRLARFLNEQVTPRVREFGSIGASGDLVPLATISGALIGLGKGYEVDFRGERCDALDVLARLGLEPLELQPKEGLALVNGTSMSTGIAANCLYDCWHLMAAAMGAHALMVQALNCRDEYFLDFIHALKPHPGQRCAASTMLDLLNGSAFLSAARTGESHEPNEAVLILSRLLRTIQADSYQKDSARTERVLEDLLVHLRGSLDAGDAEQLRKVRTLMMQLQATVRGQVWHEYFEMESIQDRYSLRCLPQYLGPIIDGLAALEKQIEIEMNSATDNPLVDSEHGDIYHGGNFLAQYTSVGMDQLRYFISLVATHLDAQIALLVEPAFSEGLPPSLIADLESKVNTGLKGLQIAGNSLIPVLKLLGNTVADRYPTHAEQFNQNISSSAYASANFARQSIDAFRYHIAMSLMFGVQSVDLRARMVHAESSCDASTLLSTQTRSLYLAVKEVVQRPPSAEQPYIVNDAAQHLDQHIELIAADLGLCDRGRIGQALAETVHSLRTVRGPHVSE